MINATSPAAKSSPISTEAINASDTSTSALILNSVTRPITASKMMGMPQRMIAAQAASKGSGSRSKILHKRAIPEITSRITSFRIPPISSSSSSFRIAFFISYVSSSYTHIGICILYI